MAMVDESNREKEQRLICRMALRVDRIASTPSFPFSSSSPNLSNLPFSSSSHNPPRSVDCSPNYFCISSILIFAGTTVLCILGFTVVLPYEATSDWPEVTCRVVSVDYNTSICACRHPPTIDDNCDGDKIPCLLVTVAFRPRRASSTMHLMMKTTTNVVAGHKLNGSCSRMSPTTTERSSVTSRSNYFRSIDSIVSTSGLSEEAFRRSTTEDEESTTSASLHSSSRTTVVTGLNLLSLIFDRSRQETTSDLTTVDHAAPTHASDSGLLHLLQPTSSIVRRKSESFNNNKTSSSIIRNDLEMEVHDVFPSNQTRTNPILIEARLYRSWYEAFYEECSVQECGEDFVNVKESVKFYRGWGSKGQTFPCYYNPHNTCIAVVERTSYWLAFNAVLWPSLAIGVGLAFWVTCICFGWSTQQSSSAAYRLSNVVT